MTPLRFLMINAIPILLMAPRPLMAQAEPAQPPADAPAAAEPGERSPAERTATDEPCVPLVITLKHADCFEVASVLKSVFPQYPRYPIGQTNTVVLSAPLEAHREVLKLVDQVDSPATKDAGADVAKIRLLHRPAVEVAKELSQVYSGRDLRIGVDEGRGWVLLRGPEAQIESVREVLKELDTPAGTANIEFAFLRASTGGEREATPIPPDLADVAKELSHLGTLSLMGRLSTVAVEGEEFIVQGAISASRTYEIEGRLLNAPERSSVRLMLHARMSLANEKNTDASDAAEGDDAAGTAGPRRSERPVRFEIGTTVTTQRGDYVVLGSAPTGWAPGESAILVLHVRESR